MQRLITTRQYGIGTTTYMRDISQDTDCSNNYKSWLEMTEQEKQESNYRSNISHIRERMITRARSKQYLFHAVFTTTDVCLRRDIKKFSRIVAEELDSQGINYFMFFELNHKQAIWQYDNNDTDAKQIKKQYGYTCYPKDSIENAYGCYNRRAFAPLAKNNDMHIHVLTDIPVDFTHYVQTVECNPNNLYCDLFYDLYDYIYYSTNQSLSDLEFTKENALHKNIRYMSKLVFYTKSKLPKNMQMYKTNNKKVDCKKQSLIIDEYGEILYILHNDFINLPNDARTERNQQRIEINSFDFEKSDYYKGLSDEEKHEFYVHYIKNLDVLNNQYRNQLIFYKKELDFLEKSSTFTNYLSEFTLDIKSNLEFNANRFSEKYSNTYNHTLSNAFYPFLYACGGVFAPLLSYFVPMGFNFEKKRHYKYRPTSQKVKIYVLKVKNRLSCKRFKRKKRKLKVKKSTKYKFYGQDKL